MVAFLNLADGKRIVVAELGLAIPSMSGSL